MDQIFIYDDIIKNPWDAYRNCKQERVRLCVETTFRLYRVVLIPVVSSRTVEVLEKDFIRYIRSFLEKTDSIESIQTTLQSTHSDGVEDCSETDGVYSAGTKAKLSIYLSIYLSFTPPRPSILL